MHPEVHRDDIKMDVEFQGEGVIPDDPQEIICPRPVKDRLAIPCASQQPAFAAAHIRAGEDNRDEEILDKNSGELQIRQLFLLMLLLIYYTGKLIYDDI